MNTADLIVLALLVGVLFGLWLLGRHWSRVPPARKTPRRPGHPSNWRARLRWFAIWWALVIALALILPAVVLGQETRQAYTTAHPGSSDWLGLATQTGRYEIALGDGCDGIQPDMNVLADTSGEPWALQRVDGGGGDVCTVVEWHWMGNTPCFTNPDGECDVAYS